jgi:predicted DCC family thiol-disulfide oxidoreductase YuxK
MKKRLPMWPRTAPYQRLNLDQHGVSSQDAARAMLWVEPGIPPLAGAAAFAQLFRGQPQLRWRTLGRMMALPGISHFAAIVYRTVSRHRHRLPGGTSACKRPLAEVREAQPETYVHVLEDTPASTLAQARARADACFTRPGPRWFSTMLPGKRLAELQ